MDKKLKENRRQFSFLFSMIIMLAYLTLMSVFAIYGIVTLHLGDKEIVFLGLRVAGPETRFLLLAAMSGFLGGCIMGFKILIHMSSNIQFFRYRWVWGPVSYPLNGAFFGSIFYLVMRGGLVHPIISSSPFGITVVALLIGIYSKNALAKLDQLINTLFIPKNNAKEIQNS